MSERHRKAVLATGVVMLNGAGHYSKPRGEQNIILANKVVTHTLEHSHAMKRRARVLFIVLSGIACAADGASRVLPLNVPGGGKPGFQLLGPETTGIAFTNVLAQERHLTNQILLNGSGVAA